LKSVGNAAVHENIGTTAQALSALKIARAAAIWFHQSYGGAPDFKPGPFVPPAAPVDTTATLIAELEELRSRVRASSDNEAKALLAYQEAEAARLQATSAAEVQRQEREFWEKYAAETEAGLRQTEAVLRATQVSAEATSPLQLELLTQFANRQAENVELDEATTRVLIDDRLRAAGWIVDSRDLRYSAGTRPQPGQAIAISEWPTDSGPVDYALFIEGRCVAVIEAKRGVKDVPGRLGQAKRYARDIKLTPDEISFDSPWIQGLDRDQVRYLVLGCTARWWRTSRAA
jgi:type I restriction enzyme R subunit